MNLVAGFTKFAVYTSPLLNQLRPVRHVRSHIYKVLYWGSGDACYWPFLLPAFYYQPFLPHGLFYWSFLLQASYYQPFLSHGVCYWPFLLLASYYQPFLPHEFCYWPFLLPASYYQLFSSHGLFLPTVSCYRPLITSLLLRHGLSYRLFLLVAAYYLRFSSGLFRYIGFAACLF